MLRERVITALIISALLLSAVVFMSSRFFVLTMLLVFVIAAWEWANLASLTNKIHKAFYALVVAGVSALSYWHIVPFEQTSGTQGIKLLMSAAVLFWGLALIWILTYPSSVKYWASTGLRCVLGLAVLVPAYTGLVYLKEQQEQGLLVILVIAIIACADIGAYFTGKKFGKTKLARNVSPGKSWEGVLGGLACNALFALACSVAMGLSTQQTLLLVVAFVFTSLVSVVGDLFESMMKRHCGVKDSGTILPGHGGVLDRIDGWTAAVPVFTLAYLLFFSHLV